MLTLEERYAEACSTPSDIYLHLPTFVRTVEELQATKVVELGTRSGNSTVAWLYALQGCGELWSVDVDPAPKIGLYHFWKFIQGDDCSPEVFTQLPNDADVVFIDTSHEYEHTLNELRLYRWLVRPGGRMLLHDSELAQPPELPPCRSFPVKRAIQAFCHDEGLEWSNDPRCFGLATIQL